MMRFGLDTIWSNCNIWNKVFPKRRSAFIDIHYAISHSNFCVFIFTKLVPRKSSLRLFYPQSASVQNSSIVPKQETTDWNLFWMPKCRKRRQILEVEFNRKASLHAKYKGGICVKIGASLTKVDKMQSTSILVGGTRQMLRSANFDVTKSFAPS